MTDLIGTQQTLIYDEGGANPITVTLDDSLGHFLSVGPGTRLEQYGYDRLIDPDSRADLIDSQDGSTFWIGRNIEPHLFQWSLYLGDTTIDLVDGMITRQQNEKQPILMSDQRLGMGQPSPRTRAKVGTLATPPTVPGMEYFWPLFRLKLEMVLQDPFCKEGRRLVSLSGREILPFPLAVTDDR